MLGLHQDIPVRRRRFERRQMAPLLLCDCAGNLRLPQRLDVLQPLLPGEGRLYRDVVQIEQSALRQATIGWQWEVVPHELLRLLDRQRTTVFRCIGLWRWRRRRWRRHSPSRRNPDPLNPVLLVVVLSAHQRNHIKTVGSLVVLLRRLDTSSAVEHRGCASGRKRRGPVVECVRREFRWLLFKAGRMSGDDFANNTKTACMPPRGLCGAAMRRRFTAPPT